MTDISVLARFVRDDPANFGELIASCGRMVDAGGDYTDDPVIGFYSLWAQSLDSRGKDEADYFEWAYPRFIKVRDWIRMLLDAASAQG